MCTCILIVPDGVGECDGAKAGALSRLMTSKLIMGKMVI